MATLVLCGLMMASDPRPDHIDLGHSNFDPQRLGSPSPRADGYHSPRTGEAPPALSPLDAFALQGRLLAAKFEEHDGRRISRLPPLTVANEFARPRPSYFTRPPAADGETNVPSESHRPEPPGTSPEVLKPKNKHFSFYPSIQADDSVPHPPENILTEKPTLEPVSEEWSPETSEEHDTGRAESPENTPYESGLGAATDISKVEFAPGPPRKAPTNESLKSNWSTNHGLIPPRSPLYPPPRSPRNQPSIRSVRMDSGDDSDSLSFQSDPYDLTTYHRKPSLKNAKDRPRSPLSPTFSGRRSPSVSSEISNSELQQPPRRSMNFSRPLSPAHRPYRPSTDSRPSFDQSTRTLTVDSPPIRPSIDTLSIQDSVSNLEPPPQPFSEEPASSLTDDEQARTPNQSANPAQSFVYRTYTLPRGRKVVSHGSFKAESWLAHQFEWDHTALEKASGSDHAGQGQAYDQNQELEWQYGLERQPTLPSIEDDPREAEHAVEEPSSVQQTFNSASHTAAPRTPIEADGPVQRSRSHDEGLRRPVGTSRFHEEGIAEPLPQITHKDAENSDTLPAQQRPANDEPQQLPPAVPSLHRKSEERGRKSEEKSRKSLDKKRSKKNLKDPTAVPKPPPDQVSAEEHLAKGIQSHEEGSLQKSTYHLRLAARAGLPPAMLLYALACRHGWGMRANQQEAVLWLRKAVDLSKLELDASDLLPPSFGGPQDKLAARQHKAQLALSIYELGVSYLNGWGIQQDKILALKCFEIAAGWGDADALSEAGFCYAKGVGCKKDLAKAASYYRKAESQGVSMAGNSW